MSPTAVGEAPGGRAAAVVSLSGVSLATHDVRLLTKGKVREMYDLGEDLLMVASDRISTFDAVHPTPIPDKGKVLTGMSVAWFDLTRDVVPNHFISATDGVPSDVRGRALRVKRLDMLPVECVVRGYITGSGWRDYQRTGSVSGVPLSEGLLESQPLPEPVFTPSSKAETGHDEPIDLARTAELVGSTELAERLRDVSVRVYETVAEHARRRGILLADTKFEFGFDAAGELTLGDEVCTPDSSRFWPAEGYEAGRAQPSLDKQYVRDWAAGTGWDKQPPAPAIPADVVARTRELYVTAYERLTDEPFSAWLERTGS
ncbi:MAG: Phosphoribosylaminoimidazole-succinocarboxamide synthase [uncultured Solirubrobacteraceae bacterium]|uniref:Phosphoribosylaminoimidazole-succinocarboxamide synthase n=1 Tax=uncultured Solirubrobacteraceae bacterium TaxID=1162706 RepID=A0A6J4R7M5_9ACTN|nr:MAG: Phosphoribosylaminoimidazole-succinocarboxamide synthase [uncultured Solirubrobacteraceae bacterium]